MKKYLILFIVFALLGATFAALTYNDEYYRKHRSTALSGSTTSDPIYLFMDEVDGIIGGTEGFTSLLLTPGTEPTGAEGMIYYNDAGNTLHYYNGSSWVTLEADSATYSLDGVYDVGKEITVDDGAVTLTAPNANDNIALAIVQADTGATVAQTITSAGTGALLSFDSNGTGADVLGSDSTWTVTKAGAATFVGMTINAGDVTFDDTYDVMWDTSEDTMVWKDNAVLGFGNTGAAPDVELKWDADSLNITAAADDTAMEIGTTTEGFDITYAFETAGTIVIDWDGDDMTFSDAMALNFGTGSDVIMAWDGTDMDITAAADASIIKWGNGTNDFDMWWYGGDAGDYMLWDEGAALLTFVDAHARFNDDGTLAFGTDSDFTIYSDTADTLEFDPATAGNTIKFGTADTDAVDMIWYGDVSGDTVTFDEESVQVQFEDIQLQMMDDTLLTFGDADDVSIQYDEDGDNNLQILGDVAIEGTTPLLLIGDAGEEDAVVAFDGNAQDFYIGLDDTDDDLNIGLGQTPGTTPAIEIDENLNVTISTSLKVPVETVTAANVITANEGGKTFILNSATEFQSTLPTASTASGMVLRFIVRAAPSGASYTIITGNSLENVIYGMVVEAETDTGDDGPVASQEDTITFVDGVATVGDWVELRCDGTNWYVSGMTAADGGVTLTQAD